MILHLGVSVQQTSGGQTQTDGWTDRYIAIKYTVLAEHRTVKIHQNAIITDTLRPPMLFEGNYNFHILSKVDHSWFSEQHTP